MANAVVSRVGQIEQAGDALALFYKVFAGEVLTAFEERVILKGLTRQRTISSGKSAAFPAIYKAGGGYHVPGTEIVGKAISHNEITISIDALLVADAFIAEIDEAMNNYDVRSPYSTELGRFLATEYDKNIARNILLAARGGALFTGDTGGSVLTNAAYGTTAATLAEGIWAGKQTLEEKDVDVESTAVNCILKPAQWYLLAQDGTKVLNRDIDGTGSYSKGTFSLIGGVDVHKSNALPFGETSVGDGDVLSKYQVNGTNTVGAVFTEQAVGTVQLLGMSTESERDIRRQGELMLAKYAVGHGPIRTKCAVELVTAANV